MTNPIEDNNTNPVPNLSKLVRGLSTALKKLETSQSNLDIKRYQSSIEALRQQFIQLEGWKDNLENLEHNSQNLREQLTSPDYPEALETALRAKNLPLSGTFPSYDIPPFKLTITIDSLAAKLTMGKKTQTSSSLAPSVLCQWVDREHKKLVASKFNQERFCKELLQAYSYLSKSEWRLPVSIKDVYGVLTIKAEARQEYPESRFIFDLSRLLDQYEIKYTEDGSDYIFELSPHKQSSKNYTVVNLSKQERAIGNLTIRKI